MCSLCYLKWYILKQICRYNGEGYGYINTTTTADLDLVTHIEATCFPPAEAAPREAFKERLDHYAGQFLIAFDGDTPIGFIDGL